MLQFKTTGGAILILGGVTVWLTVVEAAEVHPFAGSVAVTEYEPGLVMVLVEVLIPAPQVNVAPVVVDVAVIVSLVLVHVSTEGTEIVRLGATTFWLTVTDTVAVQPFEGSVTVTV